MNKQKAHPEKCSQESKGPRNLSLRHDWWNWDVYPWHQIPWGQQEGWHQIQKKANGVRKICIILYSLRNRSGSINKSRFSFTTEEGTGEKMGKREGGKKTKESSNNSNFLNWIGRSGKSDHHWKCANSSWGPTVRNSVAGLLYWGQLQNVLSNSKLLQIHLPPVYSNTHSTKQKTGNKWVIGFNNPGK